MDRESWKEVNCMTFEQDLDYEGAWLISAGSGIGDDPDYTYISNMHLYDASVAVTQKQREDREEQHKR